MQSSSLSLNATSIEQALSSSVAGRPFLLDGGTGEELLRRGLPDDRQAWSAKAVSDPQYHDLLKLVHSSFLRAGSNAITTNSYGITQHVGFTPQQISYLCRTSAKIARQAVTESTGNNGAFVLGSLGPLSESYRPDLILSQKACVTGYCLMVEAMQKDVDCFLAETMSKVDEATYAMVAVAKVCPEKPMMVSFTLGSDGNLRDGEQVPAALSRLIDFVSGKSIKCKYISNLQKKRKEKSSHVILCNKVLAILFNCSEPEAISKCLKAVHESSDLTSLLKQRRIKLGAYANRLKAVDPDWTLADSEEAQPMRVDLSPEEYFHDFVSSWTRDLGVHIVGGCCGITPEHILLLRNKFSESIT